MRIENHTTNQTNAANPTHSTPTGTPAGHGLPTRRSLRPRRTKRNSLIAAGAIAAAGLIAGTGFTVTSAVDAQQRVDATAAVTQATGLHKDQLGAYSVVAQAKAISTAKDTIQAAEATLVAADGKVDASGLQASVASLGDYERLPIDSLVTLTRETQAKTQQTAAAAAEFERAQQEQARIAAETLAQANTPEGAKAFARELAASQYGWGGDQYTCLVNLWQKESGWNYQAMNASSGATGIPQSLPGSKMATAGADWQTSAATQIRWGLEYIARGYGTPCSAWSHSQSVNWY
ncbi:aggregation-promoting factor C-terminal-like domain-containing protein [Agromyces silvae]|uniref:aggregation-promoting factor C-terminal-like domain-containing protein n=1 Tax=Agromyces silvae TaxID=3388266 RepID=UPI00280B4C75|nr:hypothetical protein [Agromyces protaetiae]